MGISYELAKFVCETDWDDIPESAKVVQKRSLLDGIAISFGAGTLGSGCRECVNFAADMASSDGDCTVIGFDKKLPMIWAAFANGSMAHALDFGDLYSTGAIHPNASTLAASLALAEHLGNVDGKQFLAALVLGSEVACRLSKAVLPSEGTKHGFYMPPVFTAFAATAATGKLLGLNVEQMLDAFSITLSSFTVSSELTKNNDTVVRSIREAFGAKSALSASLLAKRGIKGFAEPFEGALGFYHAYYDDVYDKDAVLKDLGFVFESSKLVFKPWPCCMGTHASIKSALDLVREHSIAADDIEAIVAEVPSVASIVVSPEEIKKHPDNAIAAKFSLPYAVSAAIVDGDVTLGSFTPECIAREDLLSLAAKVSYEIREEWDTDPDLRLGSRVTIKTADGKKFTEWTKYLLGSERSPMTESDFLRKLRSCASYAPFPPSDDDIRCIVEMVSSCESLCNIKELTCHL